MEDGVTDQRENVLVNPPLSAEQKQKATELLNTAIDLFCGQLGDIDGKSQDPLSNSDDLIALTTEAIRDIRAAVESFERAAGQDASFVKEAQIAFRDKTRALFSKSYFMNRARAWPQGYPGDYLTLEGVYRNYPMSNNVGIYLDKYFLSTTLAVAVRGREDKLRELLKTEIDGRKSPRILDIACGPCREVFELVPTINKRGAFFVCLDFDADALRFSQNRISNAGYSSGQITFHKYNALKMINRERNEKEFGYQDVIYSVGFFDYLSDDMLVRLLHALYNLLNPGGCLIASFKDRRRYKTFDYHWLVDWSAFLQRTEEDMWALFEKAEIPVGKIATVRDESGVIIFFKAIQ